MIELIRVKTLHVMLGLPRSGKSTAAYKMRHPVVEGDKLRRLMGCYPFNAQKEPEVQKGLKTLVDVYFESGYNDVTVDDYNFDYSSYPNIEEHVIDTSEEVCIERAKASNQEYLVPVIKRKAKHGLRTP
jgi:predicted kinase